MKLHDHITEIYKKYMSTEINSFNIFSVLHNNLDERRLHSRFISNLLSPTSSHGQGSLFLRHFLIQLGIKDFSLENIVVTPNEFDKSEWRNVDVYIRNGKQAIIIENKLFAPDSNHQNEQGQIVPQLISYYERVLIDLKLDHQEANENVHLVYLTLNKKKPSLYQSFIEQNVIPIQIDYIQFIPNWLNSCLNDLEKSPLYDAILQYKSLLFSITNNFNLTMELKKTIDHNIQDAWKIYLGEGETNSILRKQFVHLKWHTVHEFFISLTNQLSIKYTNIISVPTDDEITKITHRQSKKPLVVSFTANNQFYYIANDSKGFTWGTPSSWHRFNSPHLREIKFCEFSNFETFQMISQSNSQQIITNLIQEIERIIDQNLNDSSHI